MRFTRFSGIAATAALSAATVLGGAGIAQADSLGSLTAGSSAPAPLALTLDEATVDAVNGTFTNNTDEAVENCVVSVSHADVVRDIEAAHNDGDDINPLPTDLNDKLQAANALHQNWLGLAVSADAGETADWTGVQGAVKADADYPAGAFVRCDIDNTDVYAFAYEPGGTGSLSNIFGSLGSSDAEADDAGDADADNDTESTGSLSSLTAGSSNDDDNTPA